MNTLSCAQVQDQLDLIAAEVLDAPTRQTLERHLDQCQQCAASYAESQRLMALLGLHWNQQGMERLRQRIEQQAQRKPRAVLLPFGQRTMALAAMVLIAVGLGWWLQQWESLEKSDRPLAWSKAEPQFALLVHAETRSLPIEQKLLELAKENFPKSVKEPGIQQGFPALPEGTRMKFQQELMKAQRSGTLPPPPACSLTFKLKNLGTRPVEVRLGDAKTELWLEVKGAAVVRVPAAKGEKPEFLQPQTLRLGPGKQHVLHLERLMEGSRAHLEYIYLTRPGKYTVIPRLQVTVDGHVRTVTGEAVHIQVNDLP